jgi:WD40 repeat protein
VFCVALAPDVTTALTGGNDHTVRLWSLPAGKELRCLKGHANAVIQVQYTADGRFAYSGGSQHRNPERTWRRWDLQTGAETGSLAAGDSWTIGCTAFSADGRRVLAGGPGGFLRIWHWSR